jgi:hypothetical protein
MPRLVFLTLDHRADYVIDDDLAITALAGRGIGVDEISWRAVGVDWRSYAGVVVRTTWDYQHDVEHFLAVIEGIAALGVPLANPIALMRWNVRKTYLRELEARGVPIVPTVWGRGLSVDALLGLPARLGVYECVVKPTIGANAGDTFRVAADLSPARAAAIAALYPDREWMAQPFLSTIVTEGEYSVFYFGGVYSHTIVKRPAPGDFRVQEEHGGLIVGVEPEPALSAAARRVMDALTAPPLQARVDLVRLDDGTFALMELEVIEPSLYFRTHPGAPASFADAVERWLGRAVRSRRSAIDTMP